MKINLDMFKVLIKNKGFIYVCGVVLVIVLATLVGTLSRSKQQVGVSLVPYVEVTKEKIQTLPTVEQKGQTEEQKLAQEQTMGDLAFSDSAVRIAQSYSWFTKIPIETQEYRIVYDYEKRSFRIRLKIAPNSDISKIENLKEKALTHMMRVGIRVDREKFYFLFED